MLGEFNDAMLFLSTAGTMFLFSYASLTRVIHKKGLNEEFRGTQTGIWLLFLLFTLYFWSYYTVFFRISNLVASIVALISIVKID